MGSWKDELGFMNSSAEVRKSRGSEVQRLETQRLRRKEGKRARGKEGMRCGQITLSR
jgi:hypothetical protein